MPVVIVRSLRPSEAMRIDRMLAAVVDGLAQALACPPGDVCDTRGQRHVLAAFFRAAGLEL